MSYKHISKIQTEVGPVKQKEKWLTTISPYSHNWLDVNKTFSPEWEAKSLTLSSGYFSDIFVSKMGSSYDFTVSMIDIVTVLRAVTMETEGLACIWSNSPDLRLNMRKGWVIEFFPSISHGLAGAGCSLGLIWKGCLGCAYEEGWEAWQIPTSVETNSSLRFSLGSYHVVNSLWCFLFPKYGLEFCPFILHISWGGIQERCFTQFVGEYLCPTSGL